jgi:hypothetical protein
MLAKHIVKAVEKYCSCLMIMYSVSSYVRNLCLEVLLSVTCVCMQLCSGNSVLTCSKCVKMQILYAPIAQETCVCMFKKLCSGSSRRNYVMEETCLLLAQHRHNTYSQSIQLNC